MFFNRFPGHSDQSGCRTVTFQTAVIAAGTGNSIQIKNGMTQLTADTVSAFPDLTIDNNAAANACADRDKHAGGSSGTDPGYTFRQSGNVGVILNENRLVKKFSESFTEGNMFPSHVCTLDDFTRFRRSNSGDTDSDGFNIIRGKTGAADG